MSSWSVLEYTKHRRWGSKERTEYEIPINANIKLSEENFYSTDFDAEVSSITTIEKSLIAIEVCKL